MKFYVDTNGRWSGGGKVVLSNLELAARMSDGLLTMCVGSGRIPVVPRNVPCDFPRFRHPQFVWMPQNALPYARLRLEGGTLQIQLRVASEIVRAKASAMIRISENIPGLRAANTSRIIHNVLDKAFDDLMVDRNGRGDVGNAFLALGSAHPYRNLTGLARAHQEYVRTGGERRLLILASQGVTREERELHRVVNSNPLTEVRFGGAPREDCLRLMAGAHAVLFPSLIEASPLTLLEARASGALIGANGIPPHLALAGPNAIIFDSRDQTSLVSALHVLDSKQGPTGDPLVNPMVRAQLREVWVAQIVSFLQSVADGPRIDIAAAWSQRIRSISTGNRGLSRRSS